LLKKEGIEDGKIRGTAFRRGGVGGGGVGKKERVYEEERQDSEVRDSGRKANCKLQAMFLAEE
jgi:hypothetical protein